MVIHHQNLIGLWGFLKLKLTNKNTIMRKAAGFIAMAAAMLGMSNATKGASNAAEDLGKGFSDAQRPILLPDNGISPKHYGQHIATRQSNIIKRKRRSKLAFG